MGVIERFASLKKWLDKGNELGIHQIQKSWGCKKAYCNHFMTIKAVSYRCLQSIGQSVHQQAHE